MLHAAHGILCAGLNEAEVQLVIADQADHPFRRRADRNRLLLLCLQGMESLAQVLCTGLAVKSMNKSVLE